MELVGLPKLHAFTERHADVRGQIEAWVAEVRATEWSTPHEVRERYASASFMGKGRVVFNLKGNSYRLEAKVNYAAQVVVVMRIGTHEEYDGWSW